MIGEKIRICILNTANKIINIIVNKSNYNKAKINDIVEQIEEIKINVGHRPPELMDIEYCNLQDILFEELSPFDKEWKKEILSVCGKTNETLGKLYKN